MVLYYNPKEMLSLNEVYKMISSDGRIEKQIGDNPVLLKSNIATVVINSDNIPTVAIYDPRQGIFLKSDVIGYEDGLLAPARIFESNFDHLYGFLVRIAGRGYFGVNEGARLGESMGLIEYRKKPFGDINDDGIVHLPGGVSTIPISQHEIDRLQNMTTGEIEAELLQTIDDIAILPRENRHP